MHILDDWTEENLHFENGKKTKPKRPPRVGIEMFKNQDQAIEIESPYRKMKKSGLQKINLTEQGLSQCESISESKEYQHKLDDQYKTIMANFSKRKTEFDSLKTKSHVEIAHKYKIGELQELSRKWQKELELQAVQDENVKQEHAAQAFRDFM